MPPLVAPGSGLAMLLVATSLLLIWRLIVRAAFTLSQHGPFEALLSLPRSVIANVFGVAAAWRATGIWLRMLVRGEALRWDKTTHRFPEEGDLCAR